jgi:cytochrome c oxidase subunit 2
MTIFLILLSLAMFLAIIVQVGKVLELSSLLKGERASQLESNRLHAGLGMVFLVALLVLGLGSFWYYKNMMLGYGPNEPASEHGSSIDFMFQTTMILTIVVLIVTHILLFYFAWKYRETATSKGIYWYHNTQLEIVWMSIPAVAMTFLVVQGIATWNNATSDIKEGMIAGKDYIEIEATGQQFNWLLRHPGFDSQLGERDFRLISGTNPLGQNWKDARNHDDIHPDEIVLPVNRLVRVRITAKDVLHNFYLPQFRVKMDAVPGMPTYFVFKPVITTDSMRSLLRKYPEWQVPMKDDATKQRWEGFNYELACAELCGKGHWSMRRVIRIVSEKEYNEWLAMQTSWYGTSIKGTSEDPIKPAVEAHPVSETHSEGGDHKEGLPAPAEHTNGH